MFIIRLKGLRAEKGKTFEIALPDTEGHFFLSGFSTDNVCFVPLLKTLYELKARIRETCEITGD